MPNVERIQDILLYYVMFKFGDPKTKHFQVIVFKNRQTLTQTDINKYTVVVIVTLQL